MKKEKKLIGGYRHGDLVQASTTFCGRRTPPPLVFDQRLDPTIPKGTQGLVYGESKYLDAHLDIEFDLDGTFVRVETRLDAISRP